jgi:hypothetical protein
VAFRYLIYFFTWLATGHSQFGQAGYAGSGHLPWLGLGFFVVIPVIGGLIYGPLVTRWAREARGSGVQEVMTAVAGNGTGDFAADVASVAGPVARQRHPQAVFAGEPLGQALRQLEVYGRDGLPVISSDGQRIEGWVTNASVLQALPQDFRILTFAWGGHVPILPVLRSRRRSASSRLVDPTLALHDL